MSDIAVSQPFIQEINHCSETSLHGVVVIRCRYTKAEYEARLFRMFGIAFPNELKSAVRKRQAEFLAGRYAAKTGLAAIRATSIEIRADASRCPEWPHGTVGSISHVDGIACCAVALAKDQRRLGIDIEEWSRAGEILQFLERIADFDELSSLQALDLPISKLIVLIYSTKESVFKALYPAVRRFFDFQDVEVFKVEPARCEIRVRLRRDLSGDWPAGATLRTNYRLGPESVLTITT